MRGWGWIAPSSSDSPVYRLYNPNAGDHHYTLDESERSNLVSVGWTYEGMGWYSATSEDLPLYRQYNPNAAAGSHNYTMSEDENDWLVGLGWNAEGIGWYGFAPDVLASQGGSAEEIQVVPSEDPAPLEPQYEYEVYEMAPAPKAMYSDVAWPVFVKTDNPDPQSFHLYCGDKLWNCVFSGYFYHYEDIESEDSGKYNFLKVSGGYVITIRVPDAAHSDLHVVESDGRGYFYEGQYCYSSDDHSRIIQHDIASVEARQHYCIAASVRIPIEDYGPAEERWMDEVIIAATTADMTPPEKMQAISIYLQEKFKYSTSSSVTQRVINVAQMWGPYFVTHRFDSYRSPIVLCQFAERIGGFEEVHDCYGDYEIGTAEWHTYHYLCRVTYQGEYYYYQCCSSMSSGFVEYDMVDFVSGSQLTRLE